MKNKLVTALISGVIALSVWLYVVTVVSPNSDKSFHNVPVTLQGEALLLERGLMITETNVDAVSLHLEGNRVDLNKLSNANIGITADVSKIYEAGTHALTYDVTYPGDVASNAINTLSKSPSTVTVVVEERISKSVPVAVRYSGTLAQDYIADKENVELGAKKVMVTGPKSTIDRITKARIEVDLEGRSESFSDKFTYTLCDQEDQPVDARLVVTDVAEIILTLRIMRVKEITLQVNIIEGGGATAQTSLIKISPETIRISGSDVMLEGLDSLELGTINLAEIPEDTSFTFPIQLPEGVTNETGVTEAVVNVAFPELVTQTVKVEDIQYVNVPAGYRVDLITQVLELQVRGPKAKMQNITEDAFTATVDFTGIELGTVKLKAVISCNDPEIGAVGGYMVSATVRKSR